MRDYLEKISSTALFDGIELFEMDHVLSCLNTYTKSFDKGEYIFMTEEKVPSVGLVISGSIQMISEDLWGNRTILSISQPGDLFGESFVCASNPSFHASFYASVPSQVLFLPFRRVLYSCSNACSFHHKLTENMVLMIADKNMKLMEKVEVTSKKTLRDKILTYLSLQAQRSGNNYIEVPMGRVELADYLCADRSALTRELNNMKKEGLIDYDKNTFMLLSKSDSLPDNI